jgi:ATP-GRASP peptide maturase of grasp-with-spasm system
MILIVSQSTDSTTEKVCEWLDFFDKSYLIWNETSVVKVEYLSFDSDEKSKLILSIDNSEICLNNVEFVWYRRGSYSLIHNYALNEIKINDLKDYYFTELKGIEEFIKSILGTKQHLGSFDDNKISKLDVLFQASINNLKIPKTIVTSKNKYVKTIHLDHSKLITKSINMAPNIETDHEQLLGYTSIIDQKALPALFFPTKFQELIQKYCEIRVFTIGEEFYSMAIFSQNNNSTSVDYRNREGLPNREVPFNLPVEIQNKLLTLIRHYKLNSASFDFILTPEKEFYFLEMNNIGQFGNVSYNCNYNLEMKVASYICNNIV